MTYELGLVARSSLVLAIGMMAAWALRRQPATLRHSILAASLALAAAQPLMTRVAPPLQLTVIDWMSEITPIDVTSPKLQPELPPSVPEAPPIDWAVAAQRVWLAGAAMSGAVLLAGILWLLWLDSRSRPANAEWLSIARNIAADLQLKRRVRIVVTDRPALLVTWGTVHPVILLPADADHWPAERIRIVLAHEMAHLVRNDWAVQLLAETARALNWFNPLFWLACSRLRRDSELACDDIVLDLGVGGTSYASHLVDLARSFSVHGRTWLPAPSIARPSTLERRVRAMLNPQLNRRPVSRARHWALAAMLLSIALPIAAASQAPGVPSGTVVDPMGRPLADASVRLSSADGSATLEAKTDASGAFQFPQVAAGDYMLSLRAPGFSSRRHRVQLSGGAVTLSLQAQVGTLMETITVTAGAATAVRGEAPARGIPRTPTCSGTTGGQLTPPMKLRDVRPSYRAEWLAQKLREVVLLQATLSKDGRVAGVQVISGGNPEVEEEAMAAVSQWEFSPTYLNCEPVEVQMFVNVTFKSAE